MDRRRDSRWRTGADLWHHVEIEVTGNRFRIVWNGEELPGGAIADDRVDQGYFGVYANFVGGRQLAQTTIDGLVVRALVDSGNGWGCNKNQMAQ